MTDYQGLFQGVAALLHATNPDANIKVWASTQAPTNPRPALPYATVLFTAFDMPQQQTDEAFTRQCTAVTVTGGTTATAYTLAVNAVVSTYTRMATDTDTVVATALAAAVSSTTIVASATGGTLFIAGRAGGAAVVTTTDPNLDQEDDVSYWMTRGARGAVASIQVYGGNASQYLRNAVLGLAQPSILAILAPYGVWFSRRPGGMRNLSTFMDTNNEERALLEIGCNYMVESDLYAALSALTADITVTSDGPTIAFTVGLTP